MATDVAGTLLQAQQNYAQILAMVTMVIANPTPANVQNVISGVTALGLLTPKPTQSIDGESYDWVGYQKFCTEQIAELQKAIVIVQGPFEVRSVGL